jgi:hypothetical protein
MRMLQKVSKGSFLFYYPYKHEKVVESVFNMESVVDISLQFLFEIYFSGMNFQLVTLEICKEMHVGPKVKWLLLFPIFIKMRV